MNIFDYILSYTVKYNFLFLFFICSVFISSCSNDDIIDKEKFVNIYSDLVIAQDTSNADVKTINKIKSQIFEKYKVTSDQYKLTVDFYNRNPEKWEEFFKLVIANMEKLNENSKKQP